MGYAVFCMRKCHLLNQINMINFELMLLSEQRHDLLKFASAVNSGDLNLDHLAGMPMSMWGEAGDYDKAQFGTFLNSFGELNHWLNTWQQRQGMIQGASNGLFPARPLNPDEIMSIHKQIVDRELDKLRKKAEHRVYFKEKELDMKQKKLETRLAAMNKELESVEKAEDQAINRATPKYA